MAYGAIDSVLYKIIWHYGNDSVLDVTKYLTSHSSSEGITIENNKIELQFKIIKDKRYDLDSTVTLPFYADSATGKQMLNTASYFVVYVKYDDGTDIDTKLNNDRLKTFYLTDYSIDEPSNKLSVSAVDLQYKIINRNTSRKFGVRESGTSTTISSNTLTDSGASFKLPAGEGRYEDGLKNMTLEVEHNGNTSTYLITSNTSTTVTVHKTITEPTGATYRIGESSPYAIWTVIHESAMDKAGVGQNGIQVTTEYTLDINDNYRNGIQLLRYDNSAFPIVDIGESFMPIFKMIKELSGFSACNTELEMTTPEGMPCQRDMVFVINWDDELKSAVVNWFYLNKVELGGNYTISAVSGNAITVSGGTSSEVGSLIRIKMLRTINSTSRVFYRNYTIIGFTGGMYGLSGNAETDGVLTGDTGQVYTGADYVWDSDNDFKHIYNLKLGGTDEELYNHVLFDCGKNTVGNRSILGHWFNDETRSDTIKDTFIPMTHISKNMLNYCQKGVDGVQKVLTRDGDKWLGWNGTEFVEEGSTWSFTTTFGSDSEYVVTSRASFNSQFKTAARKKGIILARNLVTNQKENMLKGTLQCRGQRFLSVGSSGETMGQWYQKGSKILFKRPDIGLVNEGATYYNLVVTKIRQQIDATRWTVNMDVEYSRYSSEELIE